MAWVVVPVAAGAGEAAALPLAGDPLVVLSSKAIAANSTVGAAAAAGAGDPFDVGALILLLDLEEEEATR